MVEKTLRHSYALGNSILKKVEASEENLKDAMNEY